MMKINEIEKEGWIQRWAGSYTFISCDYWGRQYHKSLEKYLGIGFEHSLFIHKKGVVSFYLLKEEYENFGKSMARKAVLDHDLTLEYLKSLKDNTDLINEIMKKLEGVIPTSDQYKEFLFLFDKHLPFHNFMKKTVDFFNEEELESLLPLFKEARLYSESVYSNTESFFRSIARSISNVTGYNSDHLTCLTQEEFEKYIKEKELPTAAVLESRFNCSALYFKNSERTILLDADVSSLEKEMFNKDIKVESIKGVSAFPGVVRGTVRIVPDPFNVKIFEKGDILVTGMTRPEFLPLVQIASAIITDAGGILCHAAIIARELKKPCIVGAKVAMNVLKDGDMVEVDADNAIIRII